MKISTTTSDRSYVQDLSKDSLVNNIWIMDHIDNIIMIGTQTFLGAYKQALKNLQNEQIFSLDRIFRNI